MDLALSVLSRVLPFFLLVGAGAGMVRLRLLDDGMARGLSAYVFWIGFPALLIHALSRIDITDPALLRGLLAFALAALMVMAGLTILGLILGWTREDRAGAALAGGLGNSAFLGLPVAAAVLGPEAARLAAGVVAVDFVLVAATGIALLGWASGRSIARSVLQALSTGQVQASGSAPTPRALQAAPFAVRVKLDDDALAARLPAGSVGDAAVFTEHVKASHVIRKVLLRQIAILNYVVPF